MRGYLALAGLIALMGLGWIMYEKGYSAADDDWKTRWDKLAADYMEENFRNQVKLRAKEAEWQKLIDEVSQDAIEKINTLESDLAAAAAAADGLRDDAQAYANRYNRCRQNTGATAERPPAEDAGLLLAVLLGEMERAGREYAQEADRRGIAGKACEAAYLSLK